jgi:transcription antitermination protein NusB
VISSRRLAREWALRILYQQEVGRSTLTEALGTSLEHLRLEFVQRGSRTASGSTVEQVCLDYLTRELTDTLPTTRHPFEQAVAMSAARLLADAPYWQEQRFEKAFKTALPRVPLEPPRLLMPLSSSELLPDSVFGGIELTSAEVYRLRALLSEAVEELPQLLDAEFRQNARQFARELAAERPLGAEPRELQSFLRARREAYNQQQAERWRKVAAIIQKQLGDWLRTAGFTSKLATGAEAHRQEIDTAITDLSAGWRLERQVAVDRNILRIAGYEMLYLPGVPTGASINEAVELAKKYSTTESGRFVNGVLGALAARIGTKISTADGDESLELEDQDEPLDLPDIAAIEENDTE